VSVGVVMGTEERCWRCWRRESNWKEGGGGGGDCGGKKVGLNFEGC